MPIQFQAKDPTKTNYFMKHTPAKIICKMIKAKLVNEIG